MFVHGKFPCGEIDHVNGNPSDNKMSNLRVATRSMNNQNRRKAHKNNKSSGLLGVTRDGSKWSAQIGLKGKKIFIGSYATPELAHEAYVTVKRKIHEGNTL
jgi:hypothetical protein